MKERIMDIVRRVHAGLVAPKREHVQFALFLLGVTLVTFASVNGAWAQDEITLDDVDTGRLDNVITLVLQLIEGRFGILVMLCAGIGAIISSAFGQYRAALSLLVVALGAFILRTIIAIFFNTEGIDIFGST